MTPAQRAALAHAIRNKGFVFAGKDEWHGSVYRTSASTLQALARRGFVTLHISPDGGMVAEITDAGRVEVRP